MVCLLRWTLFNRKQNSIVLIYECIHPWDALVFASPAQKCMDLYGDVNNVNVLQMIRDLGFRRELTNSAKRFKIFISTS